MSTPLIKVGIIGAAGYTGGELLRILLRHSQVQILFAYSRSNAGKPIASAHRDLLGETELVFSADIEPGADVWFLCAGHGEARTLLSGVELPNDLKIIDLSNDFRLSEQAQIGERVFVYGLPELQKKAVEEAQNVANPGCFATAIQLALLPLASTGLLQTVHVTGITGATGAGQSLQSSLHFPWRADNISAYKTLTHQHIGEIRQSLGQLMGRTPEQVHFVPWRGDFARGIFVSAVTACGMSLSELNQLYQDFYREQVFTHLSSEPIDLKQVLNTNKCLLHLERNEDQLVIHAAIDNLLKGASGQAVQNMNLMFGLDETIGLRLKASNF